MRAVEDLLNEVHDRESRRYLAEAIGSYQAGAFRAAIVATWVAVAFDLIGKIRELDEADDPAAGDFMRGLERAIENQSQNPDLLLDIERNLIKVAHESFEFIEQRERLQLERLRQDRHVCAHPAFVRPDEVFVPAPELVRAHLATAVDAVLSKGPTPGKRAIERFKNEISQTAFPERLDDLASYLRDRYFEPGKRVLRRGLAELIVKGCLGADGADSRIVRRCMLAAHALELIEPGLLSDALAAVVTKREQGSGLVDADLMCFISNLGDMQLAWGALPDSSHARVHELLKSSPVEQLIEHHIFAQGLAEEAGSIIETRLADLNREQLAEVIGQTVDIRFAVLAISEFRESPEYTEAGQNMESLVLPLAPVMTADQVREVLDAVRGNQQIRMAVEMPELFVQFFDRTEPRFAECYQDWYELTDWLIASAPHSDPEHYAAYPELWTRVHAPRRAMED
jgi:hypothetical protein